MCKKIFKFLGFKRSSVLQDSEKNIAESAADKPNYDDKRKNDRSWMLPLLLLLLLIMLITCPIIKIPALKYVMWPFLVAFIFILFQDSFKSLLNRLSKIEKSPNGGASLLFSHASQKGNNQQEVHEKEEELSENSEIKLAIEIMGKQSNIIEENRSNLNESEKMRNALGIYLYCERVYNRIFFSQIFFLKHRFSQAL